MRLLSTFLCLSLVVTVSAARASDIANDDADKIKHAIEMKKRIAACTDATDKNDRQYRCDTLKADLKKARDADSTAPDKKAPVKGKPGDGAPTPPKGPVPVGPPVKRGIDELKHSRDDARTPTKGDRNAPTNPGTNPPPDTGNSDRPHRTRPTPVPDQPKQDPGGTSPGAGGLGGCVPCCCAQGPSCGSCLSCGSPKMIGFAVAGAVVGGLGGALLGAGAGAGVGFLAARGTPPAGPSGDQRVAGALVGAGVGGVAGLVLGGLVGFGVGMVAGGVVE